MNDSDSDLFSISIDRSNNPLQIFWPRTKGVVELHSFSEITEWKNFIANLPLNRQVPVIVFSKFERARRLYYLSWLNIDIIKAGELAALAALELALKDVYMSAYKEKNPKYKDPKKPIHAFLKQGLEYMVEHDGLVDEKLPIVQKYGGSVVLNLYRVKQNNQEDKIVDQTGTLVGIRNSLAHGDPFDALPWSGLLEVVRDLIDYMYRNSPESHERSA